MMRINKFNPTPILDKIRNSEFETVIVWANDWKWRGVSHMPDILDVIDAAYQKDCVMPGMIMYLPRNRTLDSNLVQGLRSTGCLAK